MVAAMIDLVTRIFHWKRGIKLRERLDGAMEKYSQAAAFFKSHKIIVLQVLVITFLQRGCLFLVTVAACRSLGVTAGSIGLIVLLQGMISVAVDSVSWRSRNIRGIVLKNIYTIMWRNFGTSGIDR